MIGFIRNSSGP